MTTTEKVDLIFSVLVLIVLVLLAGLAFRVVLDSM